MNLIQELGIEKCREIVEGAPDAKYFGCSIETAKYWVNKSNEYHLNPVLFPNVSRQFVYVLDDLRTAITGHDCNHTDNLSHFTDNCTDIRNHLSSLTQVIER